VGSFAVTKKYYTYSTVPSSTFCKFWSLKTKIQKYITEAKMLHHRFLAIGVPADIGLSISMK